MILSDISEINKLAFIQANNKTLFLLKKNATVSITELSDIYFSNKNNEFKDPVLFYDLNHVYGTEKKLSTSSKKSLLDNMLPDLIANGIKTLYVADAEVAKTLLKTTKVENLYGYVVKAKYTGYENISVIVVPNYNILQYNQKYFSFMNLSKQALINHLNGISAVLGSNIIHSEQYPDTYDEIKKALTNYLSEPELFIDIEGYSLKFTECNIATIAFAKDEHNGIAFTVDFENTSEESMRRKKLLKAFFETYTNKIIFHRGSFDLTVMIYELYMNAKLDNYEGMYRGLDVFTRNYEDTFVMAYLCLNSTVRQQLGLKHLAFEFAGDYAIDNIDNIRLHKKEKVLKYNLIDGLSTAFVYHKYLPILTNENQLDIYNNLFMPAQRNIINMQLVGFPLDIEYVNGVEEKLQELKQEMLTIIKSNRYVKYVEENISKRQAYKKNLKLKTKQVTEDDFENEFNPSSSIQVRELLYLFCDLPIIDFTDSGEASVGSKTLEKLKNLCFDDETKNLLDALINYTKISKILTAFIPAFKNSANIDGQHFLHGIFKLGGTLSGRLSSSDVNLQNIPATGSPFAKIIKACFKAPKGWLLVGLDFDALEMFIDTVMTKDPVKLDILQSGYDPHAFNTYYYWRDKFADITLIDVEHIKPTFKITDPETNKVSYSSDSDIAGKTNVEECDYREYNKYFVSYIKENFDKLRSKSKPVSFALQYKGTAKTLERNSGFSSSEANNIFNRYNNLYKVSIEYSKKRILQAQKDGYISLAFGLKLRTPSLKTAMLFSDSTPSGVKKDIRTIGNAISQSWGLLNNRAANEVAQELDKPDNRVLRLKILPVAQIHDAQYYLVRDNVHVIVSLNNLLQKAVTWNNHPDIYHPELTPSGKLSIFFPTWADEIKLPRTFTAEELTAYINEVKLKRKETKNGNN